MRTIRSRLAGTFIALAVAVPGAVVAAPAPAAAIGPDLLPVTVSNNTGRGDATYLYILGQDIRPGGRLGYVNSAGAFTPWPAGGLPPTPAPDVSIAGPSNGGSVTVRFPRFISARMYFSFGRKLDFRLTPDGLVQPAPWAGGDPNRDILFDWAEFTYNDAGLWLNSSQVDQFAVPHAVSVTGADGVTKRTGDPVNNGRQNVIDGIRNTPAFSRSVVTRSDGTVLRVLAPGKAMDAGLMDRGYLDGYITSAWNAYTSRTLTVVPRVAEPNRRFFGRTAGNDMVFTDASGARVATVPKPTTSNVWGCDGVFNAPNTPPFIEPEIKRTLCTALNRGTLGTSSQEPVLDPNAFYRNSSPNHYSRLIHANMADGKAYGFAYDDVGGFESLVNSGDPRTAAVVLSPFGAGGPPPSGVTLPVGRTVSFGVTNPGLTNRYLRHRDSLARTDVVSAASDGLLRGDASFRTVAALDGTPCYSFESVNFPGHYLRHAGYRLRKDPFADNQVYRQDATFCAQSGLAGSGVSLVSRNYPGHYVRHREEGVWLEVADTALARQDATWNLVAAWS